MDTVSNVVNYRILLLANLLGSEQKYAKIQVLKICKTFMFINVIVKRKL